MVQRDKRDPFLKILNNRILERFGKYEVFEIVCYRALEVEYCKLECDMKQYRETNTIAYNLDNIDLRI